MKPLPRNRTKKFAPPAFEREKIKRTNSLLWLFEPLESDPSFFRRKLFSFDAAYLDGRLYVAVKDGKEPWAGLLVCTSRERHAELVSEFPELTPHKVLGKWLYLAQTHPAFESMATEIVSLALRRDPRLGVDPSVSRRRSQPTEEL